MTYVYVKEDGEFVCRRDGETEGGERYRKVPMRLCLDARWIERRLVEWSDVEAVRGILSRRSEDPFWKGPLSTNFVRFAAELHRTNRLAPIPPDEGAPFQGYPVQVCLRPGEAGDGYLMLVKPSEWEPDIAPHVKICASIPPSSFQRVWQDLLDRPDAKVTIEVVADLYASSTELQFHEPGMSWDLRYAPGEFSHDNIRPNPVRGVTIIVHEARASPALPSNDRDHLQPVGSEAAAVAATQLRHLVRLQLWTVGIGAAIVILMLLTAIF